MVPTPSDLATCTKLTVISSHGSPPGVAVHQGQTSVSPPSAPISPGLPFQVLIGSEPESTVAAADLAVLDPFALRGNEEGARKVPSPQRVVGRLPIFADAPDVDHHGSPGIRGSSKTSQ